MDHVLPTLILLAVAVALTACGQDEPPPAQTPAIEAAAEALQSLRKPAPPDATVYFISPAHGDRVTSPVTVIFGLKGMGVAPAGIDKPDTGHHHLLVDTQLSNPNMPLPKDDQHLHFGDVPHPHRKADLGGLPAIQAGQRPGDGIAGLFAAARSDSAFVSSGEMTAAILPVISSCSSNIS